MDSNNNRPNPLIARGTVIRVLPVQEGVSKAGNAWRKGAFVIETESQYPRTICFNIWNNRIDEYALTEGDFVEVRFDVESREYMERWYTDVTAYSVSKVDQTAAAPEADPFAGKAPYVEVQLLARASLRKPLRRVHKISLADLLTQPLVRTLTTYLSKS